MDLTSTPEGGEIKESKSLFEDLPRPSQAQVAQAQAQLASKRSRGEPRLLQPNRAQVELRASDLESVVFRFEVHYGSQVHRFHDQQHNLRGHPPIAPTPDSDDPFQLARRASAPRLPGIRIERPQRADALAIYGWPQR